MQFDEKVEDTLKDAFIQAVDDTPLDVESHIHEVRGKNRGNKSDVHMVSRYGPLSEEKCVVKMQNTATERVIHHELGHVLMDSLGYDCTQEATDRACNKKNTSRWPQFSFGKKDSPVERFLIRRYGDLDEIDAHVIDDFEELGQRSDVFVHDGAYYEAKTYDMNFDSRERMRHKNPIIHEEGEPIAIKLRRLDNGHTVNVEGEVTMVDRYQLTPGLNYILNGEEEDWDGVLDLLYQLNTTWYEAIEMVKKRGDEREKGKDLSPVRSSSYYLMNVNEYFAELHARLMTDNGHNIEQRIPDVKKAYEQAL